MLTQEQVNRIIELRHAGYAMSRIAVAVNCSLTAVFKYLKASGEFDCVPVYCANPECGKEFTQKKSRKYCCTNCYETHKRRIKGIMPPTHKDYSSLLEMRKSGKTLLQIATEYGITRERVRQILKKLPPLGTVTNICTVCKRPFIAEHRTRKMCRLPDCKPPTRKIQKKCVVCQKDFMARRSNISSCCSPKCGSTFKNNRNKTFVPFDKPCEICGKSFTVDRRNAKYCSVQCRKVQHANLSRAYCRRLQAAI